MRVSQRTITTTATVRDAHAVLGVEAEGHIVAQLDLLHTQRRQGTDVVLHVLARRGGEEGRGSQERELKRARTHTWSHSAGKKREKNVRRHELAQVDRTSCPPLAGETRAPCRPSALPRALDVVQQFKVVFHALPHGLKLGLIGALGLAELLQHLRGTGGQRTRGAEKKPTFCLVRKTGGHQRRVDGRERWGRGKGAAAVSGGPATPTRRRTFFLGLGDLVVALGTHGHTPGDAATPSNTHTRFRSNNFLAPLVPPSTFRAALPPWRSLRIAASASHFSRLPFLVRNRSRTRAATGGARAPRPPPEAARTLALLFALFFEAPLRASVRADRRAAMPTMEGPASLGALVARPGRHGARFFSAILPRALGAICAVPAAQSTTHCGGILVLRASRALTHRHRRCPALFAVVFFFSLL